jgi:hypothetical protein
MKEIFTRPQSVLTGLGPTQPPMQWVQGAISLGMNGTGPEADHLLLHNSEVTNECNSTCTPPYAFMACTWASVFEILYLYAPSTHITYLFWRLDILIVNVQACGHAHILSCALKYCPNFHKRKQRAVSSLLVQVY